MLFNDSFFVELQISFYHHGCGGEFLFFIVVHGVLIFQDETTGLNPRLKDTTFSLYKDTLFCCGEAVLAFLC